MMRILLIDNYDSFTYNLLHYLKYFTDNVSIVMNDTNETDYPYDFDKIIISPGPGKPSEAGQCEEIIRKYAGIKPILGICLGHQAIATAFGGELQNLDKVLHGVASDTIITDTGDYLFKEVNSPFKCGRYHSWVIDKNELPDCLEIIAEDNDEYIMAIKHIRHDLRGLQFHPESVMSESGLKIIENWINH